eukprot:TRINITY_DN17227_c0_g1_i2.p1 TRINITY_DN17227_c0_g1~~TRINITY_DN17227_c0_g1_i2.p1  ORF type:complete len:421 (+),score=31.18 TRINITY_DN17227_c0_g1_i2:152-1414(+)
MKLVFMCVCVCVLAAGDLNNDTVQGQNSDALSNDKVTSADEEFNASANESNPYEDDNLEVLEPIPWSIGAYVAAAVIFCSCCLCQTPCTFAWLMNIFLVWKGESKSPELPDKVMRIVVREAWLMSVLPLLSLLGAPFTTCEEGVPTWLYAIYLVILFRAKLLELSLLRSLNPTSTTAGFLYENICSAAFLLSALDHMDSFTDGIFPIQAAACDVHLTDQFARSFAHSNMPFLAPLIVMLRFWGVAALVLSAATLTQQAALCASSADWAADTACFGKVAKLAHPHPFLEPLNRNLPMFFVRVLIENVPQLWLQASFFALTFENNSVVGRFKTVASLGIGVVAALGKVVGNAIALAPEVREEATEGEPKSWIQVLAIICVLMVFLLVTACLAWTVAKVWFAFECESHLWNLSSGCVQAASLA